MNTIPKPKVIPLILTLCAALASGIGHCAGPVSMSNRFMELTIDGPSITEFRTDPAGKDPSAGMSFIKSLKPEFWEQTPETRVVVISRDRVAVLPLDVWQYTPIAPPVGTDDPDKLEQGHTLGQTFNIPADSVFSTVSVRVPTWNSDTSEVTLSLYRDDRLLKSERMAKFADNSWLELSLDAPQGEGTYTVELSDPVGDVGWWSSPTNTSPVGEALVDGEQVAGDRAIQVHARTLTGTGSLEYTLSGHKLHVGVEYRPKGEMTFKSFPWRWITTWTRDGYDCTPEAGVIFSRFYTDTQRYMPIEQLKRRTTHGGLSFDGCRWIEMDGTRDADLRLQGEGMHLHWEIRPDELHLRFDTAIERTSMREPPLAPPYQGGELPQTQTPPPLDKGGPGGVLLRTEFSLTVKQQDDSVPGDFPHFACSDKAVEAELNRLWWERAFSYGAPPNRCIEFSEWMAIMRSWYDGPQHDGEIEHLVKYPITDEGYVHTYGNIVGWPLVPNRDTRHFDTNARFILACWRHWLWTGDMEFLRGQAERLRKAMRYQLEVLKGEDGLIVTPEFKTGRHEDLSNNYWDILPFGHLDAYANAAFYGSLEAMAQIEEALGGEHRTSNIERPTPDIKHPTPDFYRTVAHKSHESYDVTFWDEAKGRYVGCVDSDGTKHDYGFTFVNLEALHYGLGDADKARRIYRWMETEPTSSGEADTYSKWIFAPRATTIYNPQWSKPQHPAPNTQHPGPWWTYWWQGTPYGDQCQDGGAILYTSFFDLMDRVRYRGVDNAWDRFMQIMERYRMPDRLCGGSPLYRGETSQQENAGSVGVDYPFPESGLVPCYFLYGVMGVEAAPDGLRITPRLPKSLTWAEVRNVRWRGMSLRIRVTNAEVEVEGFDADRRPLRRTYTMKPGGNVVLTAHAVGDTAVRRTSDEGITRSD